MLRRSIACAVVFAAVWYNAKPATAQSKKALQIIPSDAAGFIVINNIGEADEKVSTLAQKMQLPIPGSPLQLFQASMGIQDGLNTKGTAVVMGFLGNQGPGMVVALPVTDYAKFAKQLAVEDLKAKVTNGQSPLGEQLVVGQVPGYALIAPIPFRAHVQHVVDSRKNIADSVKNIHGWISENDISAVATQTGIKAGANLLLKELDKAENQVGNLPPEAQMVKSFFGPARNLVKLAAKEITHIAAGGRIDKKYNVQLLGRLQYVKGGKISKFAGNVEIPKGGPLAGLPDGKLILAFGGSFSSGMLNEVMKFSMNILKADGQVPEEKVDKILKTYAKMFKGIEGMAAAMHVNERGRPIFGENMVSVIRTKDAAEYIKNYHSALNDLTELIKGLNVPGFGGTYETKKAKVNGNPALEVTVDMGGQLPPGAAGIFGEDGKMVSTMTALDKTQIITLYATAENASKYLAEFKKRGSLSNNEQIKAVSKLLPEGSQWVGYVSIRGVTEMIGQVVTQFAGGQVQIPAFPQSPPIGFGERMTDEDLDARVVIPIGVLENVMRYVNQIQQLGG